MSLHHVSLEVPPDEVQRTVEFWQTIGFRLVDPPDALGGRIPWLERDGHQVHLIPVPDAAVPALGHAAVVAHDFDATCERLRRAGFEVEEARELWGERRAFALAPAGHRVELMAAPPPPTA